MARRVTIDVRAERGLAILELSNPDWGKVLKNELREAHPELFAGGN